MDSPGEGPSCYDDRDMHSLGHGRTDVGRTREQNEDAFLVDDVLGLYVVCDGMGGHLAGEVASAKAVEVVGEGLRDQGDLLASFKRGEADGDAIVDLVRDVVDAASTEIFELASGSDDHAGMGCTLTMLLTLGDKAVFAHVGDSRLYLWRNGKTSQLTSDHTMAYELHRAGLIAADEVPDHPFAHVLTRAVGTQPGVNADVLLIELVPGDRFVLCSDGLTDHLDDDSLLADVLESPRIAEIPENLVTFANDSGGHDNVTVLVVGIHPDAPEVEIVDEMSSEVVGKFDALESSFLFEGLDVAVLTRILQSCEIEDFFDGDVLIEAGAPCAQLYLLIDGKLALEGEAGSRELLPGAHGGATSLLAPRVARSSARAVDVARVLVLHKDPFWELVKERPQLGVSLLGRLGARLAADLAPNGERDPI
jgi:serine/threonine protein phosphatase PrpC